MKSLLLSLTFAALTIGGFASRAGAKTSAPCCDVAHSNACCKAVGACCQAK